MNEVGLRTRLALATLAFIASTLLLFYGVGRLVVVQTVRSAETAVSGTLVDVQRDVMRELNTLRTIAGERVGQLPETPAVGTSDSPGDGQDPVRTWMKELSRELDLGLVLLRNGTDGRLHSLLRDGVDADAAADAPEVLSRYLLPNASLPRSASLTNGCAGLVYADGRLLLVASAVMEPGAGREAGVLVLGRNLDEDTLLGGRSDGRNGVRMRIRTFSRHSRKLLGHSGSIGRVSPVFGEPQNLVPGGAWHVGRDAFEALTTLHDLHGDAVGTLSIGFPGTLTSVAHSMLDRLLWAVCGLGAIITVLLFYGASRILVSPIEHMTKAIASVAINRPSGGRLRWRRNDEFGRLARTLDALLDRLEKDARELIAREGEHLALLAAVPDVFCVFGVDGILKSITCGSLGRRRLTDRLKVGETIDFARISREAAVAFSAALQQGAKDRSVASLVFPGEKPGEDLYVECRIVRLDEESVLAVFRDMTEEHAARQQVTEMEGRLVQFQHHESLGHLVSGISHDFNNLLGIIQASIENHRRTVEPFIDDYGDLMAVSQAVKHAAELIRQLQIYAGIADMSFEPMNLNTLVDNTWALLRASVPHHISLELEKAQHLPELLADSTQILQVVTNLLLNAAEAIGDTPGTIRLVTQLVRGKDLVGSGYSTAKELNGDWYVQLTVSDNGRGISPSQINRIIEPFFSTKGEGRGLGLATVAGILEAHEGVLSVTSQLGKGTAFHIFLPAPLPQDRPAETRSEISSATSPPPSSVQPHLEDEPLLETIGMETPQRRLCVLLVDDDPRIRSVTRMVLESFNCEVLDAEQEREARLLMQKHFERVDLFLLDANIRGMDGVRTLRVIRQKSPNLPIYLISGHDERYVRRAFEGVPFDGFIPKPFTREMIEAVLDKVRGAKDYPHGS